MKTHYTCGFTIHVCMIANFPCFEYTQVQDAVSSAATHFMHPTFTSPAFWCGVEYIAIEVKNTHTIDRSLWVMGYLLWVYKLTQVTFSPQVCHNGYSIILERFRDPTITDTVTVSEQPHVTSSLSVFVNAELVESCYEKRARLVQFLVELLSLNSTKSIDIN